MSEEKPKTTQTESPYCKIRKTVLQPQFLGTLMALIVGLSSSTTILYLLEAQWVYFLMCTALFGYPLWLVFAGWYFNYIEIETNALTIHDELFTAKVFVINYRDLGPVEIDGGLLPGTFSFGSLEIEKGGTDTEILEFGPIHRPEHVSALIETARNRYHKGNKSDNA